MERIKRRKARKFRHAQPKISQEDDEMLDKLYELIYIKEIQKMLKYGEI